MAFHISICRVDEHISGKQFKERGMCSGNESLSGSASAQESAEPAWQGQGTEPH